MAKPPLIRKIFPKQAWKSQQFFVLSELDSQVAEIVFIFLTLRWPLVGMSVGVDAPASSSAGNPVKASGAVASSTTPVILTLCPA